jgi:hypothetical protein
LGEGGKKDQVNNDKASVDELWQQYVRAEKAADEALRPFLAAMPPIVGYEHPVPDVVAYLAPHVHESDCVYALRVLERQPEVQRRRLLPDLVAASTSAWAPRFLHARWAIASLDRAWLEANIEPYVWQHLGPEATDEQYRRLGELLDGLGLRKLLQKLVEGAAASPDANIRAVAEDFRF